MDHAFGNDPAKIERYRRFWAGDRVDRPLIQGYLVEAARQIGYTQAVPYLRQLQEKEGTPAEVQTAVTAALESLAGPAVGANVTASAARAFYDLATMYYEDLPSLAADSRLDTANVWYWRDDLLQNVPVPTAGGR